MLRKSKMEMQTFKCVKHYRSHLKPQSWYVWNGLFNLFPKMPGSRQKLINLTLNKWSLIIFNQCSEKTTSRLQLLWLAIIPTKEGSSGEKSRAEMRDIQHVLFQPLSSLYGKRNNLSSLSHSGTQVHTETQRSREKCHDDGTICSRREVSLSCFFVWPVTITI